MNSDFYRQFGQLLRQARRDAGLSQEDLATSIGLTRTSISNIEQGRQKVLLHTFGQLLHVLNVPPAGLLPTTALDASERSMGLDRLRSSDKSGLKFVERAGIRKIINGKEENEDSGRTDSQEGQPAA